MVNKNESDIKDIAIKSKLFIIGKESSNLFDKNAITTGYYLKPSNGELSPSTGWNVSDFIPVDENETYSITINSNSAFFDENKTYLGPGGSQSTFTAPFRAHFFRCSISNSNIHTFQFVKGDTIPEYEPYGTKIDDVDSTFTENAITRIKHICSSDIKTEEDVFIKLRKHLENAFIKTQIKIVGDSITAGHGGTGFDTTNGEIIPPGTYNRANNLDAVCWANMLYHYMEGYVSGDKIVGSFDSHIVYNVYANNNNTGEAPLRNRTSINNNLAVSDAVTFKFYGDHFGMILSSESGTGIIDVYVDGVKNTTIDTYSEVSTKKTVMINNLANGYHGISIHCTGTKNVSSSGTTIGFEAFIIPKTVVVKPWGIGGSTSEGLLVNQRFTIDDDFVIAQYGTNDRHMWQSTDITIKNMITGITAIEEETGAEVILMASCPASKEFESSNDNVKRYFHMWDVQKAVDFVSRHFNKPFVDNYTAFINYAINHNIKVDDLLADGLHPNDLGYKVMFENIMETIGLPLISYDYLNE